MCVLHPTLILISYPHIANTWGAYSVPGSICLNKPDCFPVFLYKTLNIHCAIKLNGILCLSFFSTHWVLFSSTCPTTIWSLWRLGIYLTSPPISWDPNQVRGLLMRTEGWGLLLRPGNKFGGLTSKDQTLALSLSPKYAWGRRARQKKMQWNGLC